MKKGFTLVELLSVIVILAVISLIATPKLVGVVETSRKSAKENSAKGYINSVNDQIVSNEFNEDTTVIKDGTYYTQTLANVYGLDVSGEEPEEDSWVKIKDGAVIDFSLKFDQYVVNLVDDQTKASKGEILEHDMCLKTHAKRKGLSTYGDKYSCYVGDGKVREFYLLEDGDAASSTGTTPAGSISLIMDRNLGGLIKGNQVNAFLANVTEDWDLEATLPSAFQLTKASGIDNFAAGDNFRHLMSKEFLWDNTNCLTEECTEVIDESLYGSLILNDGYKLTNTTYGYWTSTALPHDTTWQWVLRNDPVQSKPDIGHARIDNSAELYGVRPVVVVPK